MTCNDYECFKHLNFNLTQLNLINSNYKYIWDDTQGAFIIGADVKTIFNTSGIKTIKLIDSHE